MKKYGLIRSVLKDELYIPVFLIGAGLVTSVINVDKQRIFFLIGSMILLFLYYKEMRNAIKSTLQISEEGILYNRGDVRYEEKWDNINYIGTDKYNDVMFSFFTDDDFIDIDVSVFKVSDFEIVLRSIVGDEVFSEEKLKDTSIYKEWEQKKVGFRGDITDGVIMNDSNFYIGIGLTFSIIMTCIEVLSIVYKHYIIAGLLIPLLIIGLMIVSDFGKTAITAEGIERRNMLLKNKILWDDVKRVETDAFNSIICFIGDNKKLIVPGPSYIKKSNYDKLEVLLGTIQDRNLEFVQNPRLWAIFNKNVRVTKLEIL